MNNQCEGGASSLHSQVPCRVREGFEIGEGIFGLHYTTISRMLSQKKPDELIALYVFYAATCQRQNSQSVKATTSFAAQGLQWSKGKVIRVKKRLIEMGLVEDVVRRDASNRIKGHYVRIRHVYRNQTPSFPEGGVPQSVEKPDPNAGRKNSKYPKTKQQTQEERREGVVDFDDEDGVRKFQEQVLKARLQGSQSDIDF